MILLFIFSCKIDKREIPERMVQLKNVSILTVYMLRIK